MLETAGGSFQNVTPKAVDSNNICQTDILIDQTRDASVTSPNGIAALVVKPFGVYFNRYLHVYAQWGCQIFLLPCSICKNTCQTNIPIGLNTNTFKQWCKKL